jgi:beta-glucosidase
MIVFWSIPALANESNFLEFPSGFEWCAATAPHQIEGNNSNTDWWLWEKRTHPCKIRNCEKSGPATDHWNRVEEDTQLMSEMGLTTYRMGVEWARIEPEPGVIDWTAVAHYKNEIQGLSNRGIKVMLTLQHFTLPQWVARKGGWSWQGMPEAFSNYAALVVTDIAPEVRDIVTMNEPLVTLAGGYVLGATPPGIAGTRMTPTPGDGSLGREWMSGLRFINSVEECGDLAHSFVAGLTPTATDIERILEPARGLLYAHASAYRRIHDIRASQGRPVRIGMAHHLRWMTAANAWNPLDHLLTGIVDQLWNWTVTDALETGVLKISIPTMIEFEDRIPGLAGTQDFVGVNYYTRDTVAFHWDNGISMKILPKAGSLVTDLGWEISSKGFEKVLRKVNARMKGKPIIVTENGLADCTDRYRPTYITTHVRAMHRVIQDGIPVEGYCHWSLLDNFEWLEGFGPRFGLFETDYQTFERKERASARIYSRIAKDNGLYDSPLRTHRSGHDSKADSQK